MPSGWRNGKHNPFTSHATLHINRVGNKTGGGPAGDAMEGRTMRIVTCAHKCGHWYGGEVTTAEEAAKLIALIASLVCQACLYTKARISEAAKTNS
jgi:hypothetical protein